MAQNEFFLLFGKWYHEGGKLLGVFTSREKAELVKLQVMDGSIPSSFDEVKIIQAEVDTVLESENFHI
jgi:hypothetical protein